MALWCRVTLLGPGAVVLARWPIGGPGAPDLPAVEGLARAQLVARRCGWRVVVTEATTDLAALLELVGLAREVGWQPEAGEEVLCVEEAVETADPAG